jgi:hypothetical protein
MLRLIKIPVQATKHNTIDWVAQTTGIQFSQSWKLTSELEMLARAVSF